MKITGNNSLVKRRKVVVVGAGAVGSTFCYALAQSGLAEEVAVIDKNDSLAQGQVLDWPTDRHSSQACPFAWVSHATMPTRRLS